MLDNTDKDNGDNKKQNTEGQWCYYLNLIDILWLIIND